MGVDKEGKVWKSHSRWDQRVGDLACLVRGLVRRDVRNVNSAMRMWEREFVVVGDDGEGGEGAWWERCRR